MNWFLKVVKDNYANFNGRARRKEYWMYYLFYVILCTVANVIDRVIGMQVLSGLLGLALLVPTLAVGVRRIHDTGKSGWFILVPFYNLYLLITEGDKGDNEYGADPKLEDVASE